MTALLLALLLAQAGQPDRVSGFGSLSSTGYDGKGLFGAGLGVSYRIGPLVSVEGSFQRYFGVPAQNGAKSHPVDLYFAGLVLSPGWRFAPLAAARVGPAYGANGFTLGGALNAGGQANLGEFYVRATLDAVFVRSGSDDNGQGTCTCMGTAIGVTAAVGWMF